VSKCQKEEVMARGRMLSKDISLDEKVDALSDDTARLLFTWMIPHLDREGRMYGDAQVFKSLVAPRRHYSLRKVEKSLKEMVNLGLIVRYNVNGNTFLFTPNFEKHQTGLRKERESPSQIPSPTPESSRSNDGVVTDLLPPKFKRSLSISIREDEEKVNTLLNKNEAQRIWSSTLEKLRTQVNKPNYQTWFKNTTGLNCDENHFVVGVPNSFIADYLSKNQRALIEKTLGEIVGRNVSVKFMINT